MNHYSSLENTNIEIDFFNAAIGFEENQALSKKQQRSKRMGHARRAIEKRRESKQLRSYVNEIWLQDSAQ
ncbi:MAG: hypothetical protein HRU06_17940 [Oceanospirillaceae bacterium]|nr:hypothetical protein [Oceanospirillaceae bacterium]